MNIPMRYQYETLEDGCIRLLRFTDDTPVSLLVQTFPLSNLPPYVAVSYRWGVERPIENILLNGKHHRVTPHLNAGLLRLREEMDYWSPNLSVNVAYLWIDAICIDQQNTLEKNRQVRIMGTIYSRAVEVMIWLGYGDQPYNSVQPSIQRLVGNPYWTRMWIVQELLLARRVRIIDGKHLLTFAEFCAMVDCQVNATSLTSDLSLGKVLPFIRAQAPGERPLHMLMFEFGNWQCRDEKDRVFALLSLVPDHERSCLDKFFPDYALARESVITITLSFLCNISLIGIDEASQIVFNQGVGRGLYHTREIDLIKQKALVFDLSVTPAEWNAVKYDWQKSLLSDLGVLILELRQLETSILSPDTALDDTELEARRAEVQRWRAILQARRIDVNISERGFDPEAAYRKRLKQYQQIEIDLEHAEHDVRTLINEPSRAHATCKIHTCLECAEDRVLSAKYLRDTFTINDLLAETDHDFGGEGSSDLARDTELRASHALQEAGFV